MQSIIQVSGLCKSYGDLCIINGVDLSVSKGEVFGLLGIIYGNKFVFDGADYSFVISILLGKVVKIMSEKI